MKITRSAILLLLFGFSLLLVPDVMAQRRRGAPPPFATLNVKWAPDEQLVSLADDTRTVSLQASITIDRQFWAMDVSCQVNRIDEFGAIVPANVFVASSASQTMNWNPVWLQGNGAIGENHFDSTRDSDTGDTGIQYYDQATGRINAAITRVGASNQPMGYNGTTYTQDLFNLELTIISGLTDVTDLLFTCDKVDFLNRNGESVGDEGAEVGVNYQNTLSLREGYKVSGSAARQGSDNQDEVEVVCTHEQTGNAYNVDTQTIIEYGRRGVILSMVIGQFSFDNAFGSEVDPLRDYGLYECIYTSKVGGTEDTVYLRGRSYLNLQTPEYTLQPIEIPTGDTNADNSITADDFVNITVNWQNTETPFTNGDVNGDGIVNESDVIITAGNVGLSDASGGVMLDHILYSAARDYNAEFPNNTLAMGGVYSGDINPLSDMRAFWPQVSPDGSQVAYYTEGEVVIPQRRGVLIIEQEGLAISPLDNFAGNVIVEGKTFAPSWSPLGDRIAYICSWDGFQNGNLSLPGYQYNNGNLCMVGASGGGSRTIMPSGQFSTFAEIFPPAWYDQSTIVYAGNETNPICPDQLCYYDMLTNAHGVLTINGVDGNTTKANMPVIIRHHSGVTFLFYRYFTDSNSELRMGVLDYDSATNSWASSSVQSLAVGNAKLHEQVDGSTGGVNYFDVSPMLDVIFYKFGDVQFQNLYFGDTGSEYEWTEGEAHMVDGFIGYPMLTEDNNVWDGSDESFAGTDFHALRASVDWLP